MKFKKIFVILFAICMIVPMTVFAKTQQLKIDGDHGKLDAVMHTPDNLSKYPMVIIMHGFGDKKEFELLVELSKALEAQGIASIRFDFNGHGQSEGEFYEMTIPNEIEDAKKVFNYVRNLPEVTTISLSGQSQGGVVAAMTAGELRNQITSMVLMAPAGLLRDKCIMGQIFGQQIDSLNPPKVLKVYNKFKVGRAYFETLRNLPIYETAERYQGPVCLIHGTADTTIPYTDSLRFHHIYRGSELHLLEGYNHEFKPNMVEAARIAASYFANHVR